MIAIGIIHSMAEAQFLGPEQINQLPSSPADHRIHYGSDPLQFGDLRLPQTSRPHPVAVVIHGGCWKSKHGTLVADLQNTAALSSTLTNLGIATWNIEYRQIDNPGGGGCCASSSSTKKSSLLQEPIAYRRHGQPCRDIRSGKFSGYSKSGLRRHGRHKPDRRLTI